jgi:hypothetical protein
MTGWSRGAGAALAWVWQPSGVRGRCGGSCQGREIVLRMADEPERSDSWSRRWLARKSSRAMRWVWGAAYFAGFGGWIWLVALWAKHNGHADWVSETIRPTYVLVAAITYWPPAIALWKAVYPADHRWLPWDDRDA